VYNFLSCCVILTCIDRLRSCEAAYGLLQTYTNSYETEVSWVDESYGKLNNLAAIGVNAKEQLEPTKVNELNVIVECVALLLHNWEVPNLIINL
jgi:hypothetical protein